MISFIFKSAGECISLTVAALSVPVNISIVLLKKKLNK